MMAGSVLEREPPPVAYFDPEKQRSEQLDAATNGGRVQRLRNFSVALRRSYSDDHLASGLEGRSVCHTGVNK